MNYYALDDLSHDRELAEALGNMIIAWASAEVRLFATYARVSGIGLNMAMESYYRIPTFESRTKFILSLIDEWSPPSRFSKESISIAVKKLSKLAGTRNGWVHGDWCSPKDKSHTVVFNHRVHHSSASRKKPVKARDVRDHSKTVQKRSTELAALIAFDELAA